MTPKSATATLNGDDAKYLAAIDECIAEITAIRRDMKKKRAEIQRLDAATRRNLETLRASRHAAKAV
jgi:hypothetical protein